ncbi:ubiquitin-conjugating enzyme [Colletotrichum tofieldiae]|nr:ubiquitin-conjugating enzyme [Colletotrichum tofieldiae]
MSWRIQNLPDSQPNPAGAAKKSKSKSKSSDGRGAIKRLIKELDVWRAEQKDERGIERLGPSTMRTFSPGKL